MKIPDEIIEKYLLMMHIFWELISYYSTLFGLEVPSTPLDMHQISYISENDIKNIFFGVPQIVPFTTEKTTSEVKDAFNEYLSIVLLRKYIKLFPPYCSDDNSIVDSLYINSVTKNDNLYLFNMIMIDNKASFELAKRDKNIMEIEVK